MTVEVTLLIALGSLLVGVIGTSATIRRNTKQDEKTQATEMTTVIVKLEAISSGINEIKLDLKNTKDDVQQLRERMAIVEQSTKSAHKRIDEHFEVQTQ